MMATCTHDYAWCHGEDWSDGHRRLHHGDNLAATTPCEVYLYAADGEVQVYVNDAPVTEQHARALRTALALAIRLGFPRPGRLRRLRRQLNQLVRDLAITVGLALTDWGDR
jgi:hypothetical protein